MGSPRLVCAQHLGLDLRVSVGAGWGDHRAAVGWNPRPHPRKEPPTNNTHIGRLPKRGEGPLTPDAMVCVWRGGVPEQGTVSHPGPGADTVSQRAHHRGAHQEPGVLGAWAACLSVQETGPPNRTRTGAHHPRTLTRVSVPAVRKSRARGEICVGNTGR